MSVLFILIGVSILVASGFLLSFIWSVRNGQYDDEYTPSVRMLFENTIPETEKSKTADLISSDSPENSNSNLISKK